MKRTLWISAILVILAAAAAVYFLLLSPQTVQWNAVEAGNVYKKRTGRNQLDRVLYLNDVYLNYDSYQPLTPGSTAFKKFSADISSLEVLEGEARMKRGRLMLYGNGSGVKLSLGKAARLARAHGLEILDLELRSRELLKVTLKMGDTFWKEIVTGDVGSYVIDLPGKEYKPEEMFLIIRPANIGLVTARLRGLHMKTRAYRVKEKMPQVDYFKYAENGQRQVKSVFLRSGAGLSYTIHTGKAAAPAEPVFIDGYLGSVKGRPLTIDLWVNGRKRLTRMMGHKLTYFRFKTAPVKGVIRWRVAVKYDPHGAGVLGNVAFYRPFKAEARKNVVYYLIDSLRADKGGLKQTALDKEFKDGAVFTSAYANATHTADSLPVIFTGKYKFMLTAKHENAPNLPEDQFLLAEYFKSKGYVTAAFVNNPWLERSNSSQGFDFLDTCWRHVEKASAFPSEEEYKNLKYGYMELNLRDVVRRNNNKPLFLFIHTMEPHVPYEPPMSMRRYSKDADKETLELLFQKVTLSPRYPVLNNPSEEQLKVLKALYKDQVLAAGSFFSGARDHLEEQGVINERSLLLLTSDHGERFYEHRSWIHGPPDVYNEVLRIPLMIEGPGFRAGRYDMNVQLADIFPTIMAWLGDTPTGDMVGRPLLGDPGNGRFIYSDGAGEKPRYSLVKENIKVIFDGNQVRVFDLSGDPAETVNLWNNPAYKEIISDARRFRGQFKRIRLDPARRPKPMSAKERQRLKTLGYIK
jgi:arylsulfatase A-like enzyme